MVRISLFQIMPLASEVIGQGGEQIRVRGGVGGPEVVHRIDDSPP